MTLGIYRVEGLQAAFISDKDGVVLLKGSLLSLLNFEVPN